MKIINFVIAAASLFLITSCEKKPVDEPSVLKEKDITEVSYGSHSQQKFDIYLPAGRSMTTTKVFIFIHGGGWTSGDKADFFSSIPYLKSTYFPKYAVVNMNYVLANAFTGQYALPNQIEDIQKVIDLIVSKSAEWQIKPEFVLCGHSAGAHLSMFYAYTQNNPRVKAVVSLAGPADFEDPVYANNIILGILFGGLVNPAVIPSGMSVHKYASPVTWMQKNSTPTIAFFGTTDTAVPVNEQKQRLDNRAAQLKVPYESYIWNGDHNAFGTEPNLSEISLKVKAFLAKYNP